MSAFALDYSGDPVPCDFRGCVLEAWHDGDHQFAKPIPKPIEWNYDRHCVVCGVPFTVIGADKSLIVHTCGREECLAHYARRFGFSSAAVPSAPTRTNSPFTPRSALSGGRTNRIYRGPGR